MKEKHSQKFKYAHLGEFGNLVQAAQKSAGRRMSRSAKFPPDSASDRLGFQPGSLTPIAPKVESRWKRDGLIGETVSWSVGYGPRTGACFIPPEKFDPQNRSGINL